MLQAYRLFKICDKTNRPKTLVHGHKGSRTLLLDKILKADKFIGHNPGKKINTYLTGWHVGKDYDSIDLFRKKWFKNPDELVVCRVFVDSFRSKPRARKGIFLADKMIIKKKDWNDALNSAKNQLYSTE